MIRSTKRTFVALLLSASIVSAAYLGYFRHLSARCQSTDPSQDGRRETHPIQSSRKSARNPQSVSRMKTVIGIPKILHYVFKSHTPYEDYRPLIHRCLQINSNWSVYLWRDNDSQNLITKHYLHFADKYASYKDRLEKSDSVRYMILHKFGGIYLDMDTECLQPFDKLLHQPWSNHGVESESNNSVHVSSPVQAFLSEERREQTRILYGYSFYTMNSLMGSAPGHPFFESLIDQMKSMPNLNHARLSTGPDFLTKAYNKWLGCPKCQVSGAVNVLPARLVSPLMDTSWINWEDKCRPYFKVGRKRPDLSEEDRWRMLGCSELVAKGWLFDDTDNATVTVHRFMHLGYANHERKSFDLLKEFPKVKTYY